jgi:hypothetical protein
MSSLQQTPTDSSNGPTSNQRTPGDAGESLRNGEPSAAPSDHADAAGAGSAQANRSGLERAEEIVDRVAERVASFANTVWGKKVLTVAAHAREAAQDFWAEVQQVRRGKRQ